MPNSTFIRRVVNTGSTFFQLFAGFGTDVAAPLPASLPINIGGPLTPLGDTGNTLSVSSGALVWSGTAAANTRIGAAGYTRLAGRAFAVQVPTQTTVSSSNPRLGWNATVDASVTLEHGFIYISTTSVNIRVASGSTPDAVTFTSGVHSFCIVLRGTGAFFFARQGATGAHSLVWVDNSGTTASEAIKLVCSAAAINVTVDNMTIADLGRLDARFASDEALATGRIGTTTAGDTIPMVADAWVEHTLNAVTATIKDTYVRWTNDSNTWIVRMDPAAALCKLVEKVAGVETDRLSVANTFNNGTAYRMIARCSGSSITVYVGSVKIGTYASATFQQTATTAKAPNGGDEFKSYPLTVTLPGGL